MEEELEKPVNLIQDVRDKIGSEVMSDCFVALCLSTLRQFLLSSNSKHFIFSDMFDILKEKGYPIARRTIAKYREQLDIPVARMRKKM